MIELRVLLPIVGTLSVVGTLPSHARRDLFLPRRGPGGVEKLCLVLIAPVPWFAMVHVQSGTTGCRVGVVTDVVGLAGTVARGRLHVSGRALGLRLCVRPLICYVVWMMTHVSYTAGESLAERDFVPVLGWAGIGVRAALFSQRCDRSRFRYCLLQESRGSRRVGRCVLLL
mmetsp:Transcript_36819/g.96360  ORF Transcript_36819/g.96360 Transcript_36819/m.96360 type:complete len:171 (+) Transcript_36819:588-1100(+)